MENDKCARASRKAMSRGSLHLPMVALLLLASGTLGSGAAQDDGALPLTLPTGTPFEGHVLAGLVRSSQPLAFETWTVRAYNVTLHEGSTDAYSAPVEGNETIPTGIEPLPKKRQRQWHSELEITFTGTSRRGHVGIHGAEGTTASFVGSGPCTLETRDETLLSIGKPVWISDTPYNKPDAVQYYHRVEQSHVLATCAGTLRLQGPAVLQIFGLDVAIRTPDGANRTASTGFWVNTRVAVEEEHARWVNLDAGELVLESRSPMRWQVALLDARTDGAYVTPDRLVLIQESLAPAPGPVDDAALAPLRTTAWILAVGAVAAGAVLVYRARGRSRLLSAVEDPQESWDAEECMSRADLHIQAERWDRALAWVAQARRLAPTSYTVRATEGFLLGRLGRVDEALDAYREAGRLAPEDGGPDLEAARLAVDADKPHAVVEEFVERALAKNPLLVPEVDEQEDFRVLAGSPRFDRAVSAAWEAYADRASDREE